MANPERKGALKEIFHILVKSAIVVGILGMISRAVNWERLAKIKEVVFSRKN